jgi:hypothetical protein
MIPAKVRGRPKKTGPRMCKVCGTKLNKDNTYSHGGRRVTCCKDCEKHRVQMLRLRKKGCTNKCQYSYEAYRNYPIFFAEKENKRQYLLERKLIKIGSRDHNDYSSIVGKNCYQINRVDRDGKMIDVHLTILCDECQSVLRFNINVELVCENCGLISEVLLYEENAKTSTVESSELSNASAMQDDDFGPYMEFKEAEDEQMAYENKQHMNEMDKGISYSFVNAEKALT